MRTILSSLGAAALLAGSAAVAQAQDAQTAPSTLPPEQTAPGELPPIDPRLDPNGPASMPPADSNPLGSTTTEPMAPAAPPGTVPPAPPPESEDGTDVLDDNEVGPDDDIDPSLEEDADEATGTDPMASDRLEPDPTQPPL